MPAVTGIVEPSDCGKTTSIGKAGVKFEGRTSGMTEEFINAA